MKPEHYETEAAGMEPIDVIDACGWGYMFAMGNVLKYLSRAHRKGDRLGDYRKALFYARHACTQPAYAHRLNRPDPADVCEAWGITGYLARQAVRLIMMDDPERAVPFLERLVAECTS